MKPLDKLPVIKSNTNPFFEQRIQEIFDFWESGAEYCELTKFSDVTISREVELYKRAVRYARFRKGITPYGIKETKIVQRNKMPYAIRGEEPIIINQVSEELRL